jgi:predicted nucleic acid-binding protein
VKSAIDGFLFERGRKARSSSARPLASRTRTSCTASRIRRCSRTRPAIASVRGCSRSPPVVDDVFDTRRADAEAAKDILLGAADLSARDAIHVAVMRAHGVDTILSFDRGFDAVPGIHRLR